MTADVEPAFDPHRLVEVLARHGVDYMIVGGVAAQAHGATRATGDLDCLAQFSTDNLRRLCDAMRELNARIRADGFPDDDAKAAAPAMLHPDTFRRAELSTWLTDSGKLDILHDIPARRGERRMFEDLIERSDQRRLGGVVVQVAALDDVIESKRWANRPKDREALAELDRLQQDPPRDFDDGRSDEWGRPGLDR